MLGINVGKIEKKEQDMQNLGEKINIEIFNWGPCVVKCKIKPEFAKLLLDEAKSNKDDYRTKLAGQIDLETGYTDESKKKFIPRAKPNFKPVAVLKS